MKNYTLPFTYTVNGTIEIEASSLGDAVYRFTKMMQAASIKDHVPVLDKAKSLIPDLESFEVDEDEAEEINPLTRYTVSVTRTQTVDIEVEAHSEDEAEDLARAQVESGEHEADFDDEVVEVSDIEEC